MNAVRRDRPRRGLWWLLAVAFVLVPLIEIYLIIQVGEVIGAGWTILLLVADIVLGSWLIKRAGGRAWAALRTALQQGRMPHLELADGVLIVIGGALMLTPGFLSDVVGILFVLPLTRPLGRRVLAGLIGRRLSGATPYGGPGSPATVHDRPGSRGGTGDRPDVVRGDVVD